MLSHINSTTIATISLIVSIVALILNNRKLINHEIWRNIKGFINFILAFLILIFICELEVVLYAYVPSVLFNKTVSKIINNFLTLPMFIFIAITLVEGLPKLMYISEKYINDENIYCYPKGGSIEDKFPVEIYHDFLIRIKNKNQNKKVNNTNKRFFTQEEIELIDPTDNNSSYNIIYELEQDFYHPKHLSKSDKILNKIITYLIVGIILCLFYFYFKMK